MENAFLIRGSIKPETVHLGDVSRKVFEAARRTKSDNGFKQCFEMSLANTKNAVHARLTTQRKILATLRAMWLSMQPYRHTGF